MTRRAVPPTRGEKRAFAFGLKTADGGAWSKKHRIQPFRSVGKGRTSKRQRIVRRNPWERIGLQFNQEAKKPSSICCCSSVRKKLTRLKQETLQRKQRQKRRLRIRQQITASSRGSRRGLRAAVVQCSTAAPKRKAS